MKEELVELRCLCLNLPCKRVFGVGKLVLVQGVMLYCCADAGVQDQQGFKLHVVREFDDRNTYSQIVPCALSMYRPRPV